MLARLTCGEVAEKHHVALRDPQGRLRYEECVTRDGFEGPYTLLYHREKPQALNPGGEIIGPPAPSGQLPEALARRHYRALAVQSTGKTPLASRTPLLFNDDLTISIAQPTAHDEAYVANGDGDELLFIHEGAGTVRSVVGDLRFQQNDYVFLPRALLYRIVLEPGTPHRWLSLEFRQGLDVPKQWRNSAGQLRLDAPFCHRDFRTPTFRGPLDEGIRQVAIKRNDRIHPHRSAESALDVVGWDGTVYPFVFPILKFQPRVGLVHLPPTWHGTFAGSGALVCSFVPRPVDFHPQAIPCPYPHSNVNVDEVIFYCSGNFTSRRGIAEGSLSLHPAGVPHGPQGDAYERSIGSQRTEELAVMLDVFRPLKPTEFARAVEDPGYPGSFT